MRIIAFDPGESCGYAIGELDNQEVLHITDFGYKEWQPLMLEFSISMRSEDKKFAHVVFEAWHLRKPKELYGSDMPSSQCIGQIKAACYWFGERPRVFKSSTANKPVADKLMEKLGIKLPKDSKDHAKDALRHLVWYAVTKLNVTEVVYDS